MYAHFHDQDVADQRFSNGHDPNHLKVQTKNDKSFEFISAFDTEIWLVKNLTCFIAAKRSRSSSVRLISSSFVRT